MDIERLGCYDDNFLGLEESNQQCILLGGHPGEEGLEISVYAIIGCACYSLF